MIQYKQVPAQKNVPVKIVCNCCGKDMTEQGLIEHGCFVGGTVSVRFGYGSQYDMTEMTLHVCDDCVENKILKMLVAAPEINDVDPLAW